MGESLWPQYLDWLKDNGDDVQKIVLHSGVNGLLESFEHWLNVENYILYENGQYVRG